MSNNESHDADKWKAREAAMAFLSGDSKGGDMFRAMAEEEGKSVTIPELIKYHSEAQSG